MPLEEEKAKERMDKGGREGGREGGRGKKKTPGVKVDQGFSREPKAAEIVAKEVGVSASSIYDAKKVMTEAPEVFQEVLSGEKTTSEAKRTLSEKSGKSSRPSRPKWNVEDACDRLDAAISRELKFANTQELIQIGQRLQMRAHFLVRSKEIVS